mmetsp:Transcript_172/g.329  ORF Transcript_172/g.329 Transcript_172/m.329 type:complete len:122 (-) Transcript_172:115-480(-)
MFAQCIEEFESSTRNTPWGCACFRCFWEDDGSHHELLLVLTKNDKVDSHNRIHNLAGAVQNHGVQLQNSKTKSTRSLRIAGRPKETTTFVIVKQHSLLRYASRKHKREAPVCLSFYPCDTL